MLDSTKSNLETSLCFKYSILSSPFDYSHYADRGKIFLLEDFPGIAIPSYSPKFN